MKHDSGRIRHLIDRLEVTVVLAAIGAAYGAMAAGLLTFLANGVAGTAIMPGVIRYSFNVAAFALCGATFGPVLAWTMLRRVPLWRTLAEPALGGVVGALLALVVAPPLFPAIVPATMLGSAWRLRYEYRNRTRSTRLDSPKQAIRSYERPSM